MTSVAAFGHEILGGSVDGTLRRFDIRIGRAYTDDLRHAVTAALFTSDGLCALAACLDGALRLVDKATGELLATYRGHVHSNVKMGAALTPGDEFVVGTGEDGEERRGDWWRGAQSGRSGVFCCSRRRPGGGRFANRPTDRPHSKPSTRRKHA